MSMRVVPRIVGGVLILDCSGRITLGEGSVILRDSVKNALSRGQKQILLNFADVTYIDSMGVGELVIAFTTVRKHGGSLKLLALTRKVNQLLRLEVKLTATIDVFADETMALESFCTPSIYYCCPLCHCASSPSAVEPVLNVPRIQLCPSARCGAKFKVFINSGGCAEALSILIQTYQNEYLELLSGPPLIVRIVGRLDLFSSSALRMTWSDLPKHSKVVFDLGAVTEIADAGSRALMDLLADPYAYEYKDVRAVVSLEGLSMEQLSSFPSGPPFYPKKAAAVGALGDVSVSPLFDVRVLRR